MKKVVKRVAKISPYTFRSYDAVIIGGGPAGLMAACVVSANGAKILVLEKNEELGKKLLISGGGRCNLTNANPDHREFVNQYGKKGNFLFSPFSIFGVSETIKFFNDLGLKTKMEPGYRIFPVSDNSFDVLNILIKRAQTLGVEFKTKAEVSELISDKAGKNITGVLLKDKNLITAKNFVLATGGLSHPETGSTGDGFKWLKKLGHKIIEPNPSLVPIEVSNDWISSLAGLTLDNVSVSVWKIKKDSLASDSFKKDFVRHGRLLFTHNGLSGPMILNLSKKVGDLLKTHEVLLSIDFFPGRGLDDIQNMVQKVFTENLNKKVKNLSFKEIPEKIYNLILKQLKIDAEWPVNEIKRGERLALVEKFKKFELNVVGLLGYDKAIISSGGLDLKEVDFKSMKSKLYSNLFLVGDVLDFDRPSGGFSLQLCWTTGYLAGKSIKDSLQ